MEKHFYDAFEDYRFLIARGYTPKGFLELIANRYNLTGVEKSVLYRGIATDEKIRLRNKKIVNLILPNERIVIDGMNVLTTIASYLLGLPVFVSLDGILRDAAQMRGRLDQNSKIGEAAGLLMKYLNSAGIESPVIYLDYAEGFAEKVSRTIQAGQLSQFVRPEIEIRDNPDAELVQKTDGLVCTSDSEIIDHTSVKIFDLARAVLDFHFHPDYLDLQNLDAS